jgi:formylglycine-generating enzyme required for sulfatase activity
MRGRSKLWSFVFSGVSVVVFFVACSSAGGRPDSAGVGSDGGNFEATVRDALEDTGDSGTCKTKVKDGNETDIDCGGNNTCPRCELGKACTAAGDCAEGADCKNKLCALCSDELTNGDETDRNCGGKACDACTVGKRCIANTDCRSGSCINQACACPKDMTIVPLAAGGAYCIDQAEVSKGQYYKFWAANVPVGTQEGACLTANANFTPRDAWPPASAPGDPTAALAFNLGLPVHFVDWCDAIGYCKWAKKELCGSINGGPVAAADSTTPAKSAWYNACSAQGVRTYPYGDVFDPTRCNDNGIGTQGPGVITRDTNFGYADNHDDGVYQVAVSDIAGNISAAAHASCQGGSVGVYQMSGNVAEWENSCDGSTAISNCRVRGGSYMNTMNEQTCTSGRDLPRMPAPTGNPATDPLKDIGFRCCQY